MSSPATDEIRKLVDEWYVIDSERLELQRQVDALEDQAKKLKEKFTERMKASDILKMKGSFCEVEVLDGEPVPTARSWELFYEYVLKTGSFDLLQKRLSSTAFKARWEDGEHIPGIDKFPVTKLKVTNKKPIG